jgi:hypothetical protein
MVILILVGLLFAVIGIYGSRRQLLLRRKGQRVTGTVTRIDREWDPGGGPNNAGQYDYWPVLSFTTLAGQHIETRSEVGKSSASGEVGQPVRVLYDPANPSAAEVDNFSAQATATLLPLICVAAGIGVAVVGIVNAIGK